MQYFEFMIVLYDVFKYDLEMIQRSFFFCQLKVLDMQNQRRTITASPLHHAQPRLLPSCLRIIWHHPSAFCINLLILLLIIRIIPIFAVCIELASPAAHDSGLVSKPRNMVGSSVSSCWNHRPSWSQIPQLVSFQYLYFIASSIIHINSVEYVMLCDDAFAHVGFLPGLAANAQNKGMMLNYNGRILHEHHALMLIVTHDDSWSWMVFVDWWCIQS